MLSVERIGPEYHDFGLTQVPDPEPGHGGPLGGLLAALRTLQRRREEWLLLVPCDAPFLPLDLGRRLRDRAQAAGRPGAVVRCAGQVQPTFSLWKRTLLPVLEEAVTTRGMAGFKQFLDHHPLGVLDWPDDEASYFFNINDPAALARAARLLDQTEDAEPCSV